MLQVTYMVRNSDWVLTNAARGNNDIELCAVAKHQDRGPEHWAPLADKFAGKYGLRPGIRARECTRAFSRPSRTRAR